MGRVVKSARHVGEKYVVAVPHATNGHAQHAAAEPDADELFAAFLANEPAAEVPVRVEPAIDFAALRRDAEAIVEQAAADAQAMIRQAEAAAHRLVETAEAHAVKTEEESRTRGFDSGFADGKAAADADMSEMVHTLHGLMESVREQRAATMVSAEPELVRLAMSIAERVVHDQISVDPNVVVENVRSALTRLVSREVVTLRVHPSDLDTMRQHRDAIVAVSDVEHLRIVEDQRVDRGGVVVETDAGTIDAKIATQLREARRAIRADHDIAS